MRTISIDVDVDLDDYVEEIVEELEYEFKQKYDIYELEVIKENLQAYIEELDEDLNVYCRPTKRTVESILQDLKGLL